MTTSCSIFISFCSSIWFKQQHVFSSHPNLCYYSVNFVVALKPKKRARRIHSIFRSYFHPHKISIEPEKNQQIDYDKKCANVVYTTSNRDAPHIHMQAKFQGMLRANSFAHYETNTSTRSNFNQFSEELLKISWMVGASFCIVNRKFIFSQLFTYCKNYMLHIDYENPTKPSITVIEYLQQI